MNHLFWIITRLVLVGSFWLPVDSAFGHARLVDPQPRSNRDNHKNPAVPCGPDVKKAPTATYQEGQTIMVRWEETINHNGSFEFSLSTDNDVTFKMIPGSKVIDNKGPGPWSGSITLPPGVTCENCTFRMSQNMNDDPNQPYQSCADIRIVAAAAPPPPPIADPPPPVQPPPPSPPGSGGGSGPSDLGSVTPRATELPSFGGCGNAQASAGGTLDAKSRMGFILHPLVFALVWLGLRRRSRRLR